METKKMTIPQQALKPMNGLKLFCLKREGEFRQEICMLPLANDGRVGVSAHFFWNTDQTGEEGSKAALVRYEPGARALAHEHTGYEFIHVLEGQFECEEGVYPAGSILIAEPGSSHRIESKDGCLLFVIWEKPVSVQC